MPDLPELDFFGPWRDDSKQQQRVKLHAAESLEKQFDAAVMIKRIERWQANAEGGGH